MNKWIEKSITLANSRGYLDDLFRVYPVSLNLKRDIPNDLKIKIESAFKSKNKKELIKKLLELPRFPINDPYIASLRKYHNLLEKNPKTIQRIGSRLLSIGIDDIFEMAIEPKSSSRQFGNIFQNWLPSLKIPFLAKQEFKKYNSVSFLKGSDSQLKDFAKNEIGIKRLNRRPDFILKVKNKFILGEAKFLTDNGGTQNNQFDGALRITQINNKNCVGVAVIDGIVWFESNTYMHKTIKKFKKNAFSALLLKEFIEEIK
ncbi:restriction endonuclease [Patescibacteria group bacterium]|nr:restriction endonuclease [Patescibacteria group bacterium]